MQNLWLVDNEGNIDIEDPFILSVPEFKRILKKLRKGPGDHDGRKKVYNRMILAYVYYIADWSGRNYLAHLDTQQRHNKAVELSGLGIEFKPDRDVQQAIYKYAEIQRSIAPSSHSYMVAKRAMTESAKLLTRFSEQNKILDKTLEQLYERLNDASAGDHIDTDAVSKVTVEIAALTSRIKDNIFDSAALVKKVDEAMETVDKLEKRVKVELEKNLGKKKGRQLGNREDPNYQKSVLN